MYFDTLNDNGLAHVAKYIHTEDWPSFTRVEDIIPLLDARGELGCFLRHRVFTILRLGRGHHIDDPVKKGMVCTDTIEAALKFVRLAGKYIREIHLRMPGNRCEYWNWEKLGGEFARCCPNLRSLEITEGGREWITAFGPQLEGLQLIRNPPIAAIEVHCRRLRDIELTLTDTYAIYLEVNFFWENT